MEPRKRILNSKVISASLGKGRHIQLSQPIRLVLRHLIMENVTNPSCVFWNYIDQYVFFFNYLLAREIDKLNYLRLIEFPFKNNFNRKIVPGPMTVAMWKRQTALIPPACATT